VISNQLRKFLDKKKCLSIDTFYNMILKDFSYPNGLSPKGLLNGSSFPLLPPLRGGGSPGIDVIITSEIELSKMILTTSGLLYDFLGNIF